MSERRYLIKPNNSISFGYYNEERECFDAQVDILGIGSENAVMVTDQVGATILCTNPDLTCELPYVACWCLHDIVPLLEANQFISLERTSDMSETENLRRAHDALLARIKEHLPEFEDLQEQMNDTEESGVYQFYHSDPHVYGLQHFTEQAICLFRKIASHDDGNLALLFELIIREGTNRPPDLVQSKVWILDANPVVSAFYHAKYFIKQHVRYGKELEQSPDALPPGWAAILCLYQLR
jgi:hypothetical protein